MSPLLLIPLMPVPLLLLLLQYPGHLSLLLLLLLVPSSEVLNGCGKGCKAGTAKTHRLGTTCSSSSSSSSIRRSASGSSPT
jgi:hypothetical protein